MIFSLPGVDVLRFTEDDNYKHETILGLAMCVQTFFMKDFIILVKY